MKTKTMIIGILLFFTLLGCHSKQDRIVNDIYTPIVIESETDLKLAFDIGKAPEGCMVNGVSNLPDGTRLTISLLENGDIFAQNAEVFTKGGAFEGRFGVSYNRVHTVRIMIIDNIFNQDKSIASQLEFIQSPLWISDDFGRTISYTKEVNTNELPIGARAIDVIKPPLNYNPKGVVEGAILAIHNGNIKRYRVNLIFSEEIAGDCLTKEVRYWLNYVYEKNPDSNAIMVGCYLRGSNVSFMNAYFAPYGDWQRAGRYEDFSNYEVSLTIF
jgi:hypothetical protein